MRVRSDDITRSSGWRHTAITASPMNFCDQAPALSSNMPARRNTACITAEIRASPISRDRVVKPRTSITITVMRLCCCTNIVASPPICVDSLICVSSTSAAPAGSWNFNSWRPIAIVSPSVRRIGVPDTARPLSIVPLRLPESVRNEPPLASRRIIACSRLADVSDRTMSLVSARPRRHTANGPSGTCRWAPSHATRRNGSIFMAGVPNPPGRQ